MPGRRSSAAATAGLVVLPAAVVLGAALLLALEPGDLDPAGLLLGTTAILGLVLPPLVAGAFARSFGRDPAAGRRRLVGVAVLVLVQVAAAALLLLVRRSTGLDLGAALLVLIAALVLDLVLPLLGAAARQPVSPVAEGGIARAAALVRCRMGVGAVAGGVLGALLLILLLLSDPGSGAEAGVLLLAAAAALGASLVSLPAYLGASRDSRGARGGVSG